MNFPFSKIGINFYFVLIEMCFYRAVFYNLFIWEFIFWNILGNNTKNVKFVKEMLKNEV